MKIIAKAGQIILQPIGKRRQNNMCAINPSSKTPDLYRPGFGGKKKTMKELSGLEKQNAFLTEIYSAQLLCPVCGKTHSYIEARGSSDWAKQIDEENVKCPSTGEPLSHNLDMFGAQWFSKR